VISNLPRAVPAPPGKPVRPEAHRGQERARRLALRPGTWTQDEAAGMRADFDQAAAEWNDDRGGYRPPVLADALARGGPFRGSRAVEIASGTGLLTPLIRAVWPDVVAVDLSLRMLSRSVQPCRIQADASRLPLADDCADVVVLGDGPLFAAEVARVLVDGAPLIVSNALGDGAPFRVPAEELVEAMVTATSRPWNALQSEAHWGTWTILRPA
jgi:SAM-dependent methyltransferase